MVLLFHPKQPRNFAVERLRQCHHLKIKHPANSRLNLGNARPINRNTQFAKLLGKSGLRKLRFTSRFLYTLADKVLADLSHSGQATRLTLKSVVLV